MMRPQSSAGSGGAAAGVGSGDKSGGLMSNSDAGDFFCQLTLLISESRLPLKASKAGRRDGPHCPVLGREGLTAAFPHQCTDADEQCRKARQLTEKARRLWSLGIPAIVQVFLLPEQCRREEGCLADALIVERWELSTLNKRASDRPLAAPFLLQAVRSFLHFSQLSAWLSAAEGQLPAKVIYRLCLPGEDECVLSPIKPPQLPPARPGNSSVADYDPDENAVDVGHIHHARYEREIEENRRCSDWNRTGRTVSSVLSGSARDGIMQKMPLASRLQYVSTNELEEVSIAAPSDMRHGSPREERHKLSAIGTKKHSPVAARFATNIPAARPSHCDRSISESLPGYGGNVTSFGNTRGPTTSGGSQIETPENFSVLMHQHNKYLDSFTEHNFPDISLGGFQDASCPSNSNFNSRMMRVSVKSAPRQPGVPDGLQCGCLAKTPIDAAVNPSDKLLPPWGGDKNNCTYKTTREAGSSSAAAKRNIIPPGGLSSSSGGGVPCDPGELDSEPFGMFEDTDRVLWKQEGLVNEMLLPPAASIKLLHRSISSSPPPNLRLKSVITTATGAITTETDDSECLILSKGIGPSIGHGVNAAKAQFGQIAGSICVDSVPHGYTWPKTRSTSGSSTSSCGSLQDETPIISSSIRRNVAVAAAVGNNQKVEADPDIGKTKSFKNDGKCDVEKVENIGAQTYIQLDNNSTKLTSDCQDSFNVEMESQLFTETRPDCNRKLTEFGGHIESHCHTDDFSHSTADSRQKLLSDLQHTTEFGIVEKSCPNEDSLESAGPIISVLQNDANCSYVNDVHRPRTNECLGLGDSSDGKTKNVHDYTAEIEQKFKSARYSDNSDHGNQAGEFEEIVGVGETENAKVSNDSEYSTILELGVKNLPNDLNIGEADNGGFALTPIELVTKKPTGSNPGEGNRFEFFSDFSGFEFRSDLKESNVKPKRKITTRQRKSSFNRKKPFDSRSYSSGSKSAHAVENFEFNNIIGAFDQSNKVGDAQSVVCDSPSIKQHFVENPLFAFDSSYHLSSKQQGYAYVEPNQIVGLNIVTETPSRIEQNIGHPSHEFGSASIAFQPKSATDPIQRTDLRIRRDGEQQKQQQLEVGLRQRLEALQLQVTKLSSKLRTLSGPDMEWPIVSSSGGSRSDLTTAVLNESSKNMEGDSWSRFVEDSGMPRVASACELGVGVRFADDDKSADVTRAANFRELVAKPESLSPDLARNESFGNPCDIRDCLISETESVYKNHPIRFDLGEAEEGDVEFLDKIHKGETTQIDELKMIEETEMATSERLCRFSEDTNRDVLVETVVENSAETSSILSSSPVRPSVLLLEHSQVFDSNSTDTNPTVIPTPSIRTPERPKFYFSDESPGSSTSLAQKSFTKTLDTMYFRKDSMYSDFDPNKYSAKFQTNCQDAMDAYPGDNQNSGQSSLKFEESFLNPGCFETTNERSPVPPVRKRSKKILIAQKFDEVVYLSPPQDIFAGLPTPVKDVAKMFKLPGEGGPGVHVSVEETFDFVDRDQTCRRQLASLSQFKPRNTKQIESGHPVAIPVDLSRRGNASDCDTAPFGSGLADPVGDIAGALGIVPGTGTSSSDLVCDDNCDSEPRLTRSGDRTKLSGSPAGMADGSGDAGQQEQGSEAGWMGKGESAGVDAGGNHVRVYNTQDNNDHKRVLPTPPTSSKSSGNLPNCSRSQTKPLPASMPLTIAARSSAATAKRNIGRELAGFPRRKTFHNFDSQTGLPLSSSPAPLKRNQHSFDYDASLTTASAIRRALYDQHDSGSSDSEGGQPLCKSAPASTNLLGNFEESALTGRLKPFGQVDGFEIDLGASGAFVPRHVTLPLNTYFFQLSDDNAPSPYFGYCSLESVGRKGYHVPKKGTVQVTLFNPQRTVVKMFVVCYDLADMPVSSQTFVRQRTFFMPTQATLTDAFANRSWLRYLIHLRFATSRSGKLYLHSDLRMLFSRKSELETAKNLADPDNHELRSFTEMPKNPKYSPRKIMGRSEKDFRV